MINQYNFDSFTQKHFRQWMDRAIPIEEWEETEERVLTFLNSLDNDDRAYWLNKDWREITDKALAE